MAARAAVRSGAGLVTALVPRCITDVVAAGSLEAMVYGAPETSVGSLSTELLPQWRPRLGDFDAVLIGPGLTLDNDSLVLENFRHFFVDYLLAQTLDNGGFADTGFADEDRIVLCASAEYLYQSLNLIFSSDYRVKLVIGG